MPEPFANSPSPFPLPHSLVVEKPALHESVDAMPELRALGAVVNGPQSPWPCMTQKQAARALGVDVHFLAGLRNHHGDGKFTLRAVSAQTAKGNWIILYNREDIQRLARTMKGTP